MFLIRKILKAIVALIASFGLQNAFALDRVPDFAKAVRPTINRAADVIAVPSGSFRINTKVLFQRLGTSQAKAIVREGFQIRIFALGADEKVPSPRSVMADCDIYISTLLSVDGGELAEIPFAYVDESWLKLSHSEKTIENGRFFLVFEEKGASDEIFRLRSKDATLYFSQGFSIEIEKELGSLERVKKEYSNRIGRFVELVSKLNVQGSTIPCFSYKRRPMIVETESEREISQGELLACTAGP